MCVCVYVCVAQQEKEVTITLPNGETSVATVRIWNETVSNLTLMALGSSAPEILLSLIEVRARVQDTSMASEVSALLISLSLSR